MDAQAMEGGQPQSGRSTVQHAGQLQEAPTTQEERLATLLDFFLGEDDRYRDMALPTDYADRRRLLRSLMNVRPPRSVPQQVLDVQDAFLAQEATEKGIVCLADIPTAAQQGSAHPQANKLSIWQGDITRLQVGAIVNAANSQMLGCFVPCHGCIDNAIHSAAGVQLREECERYMARKRVECGPAYQEPTGAAMLTDAYNLSASHVAHTVGPIVTWHLSDSLRADLRNCYESVLECCAAANIRSVAFCCISTGEFHFPNDEAAHIAVETVSEFLAAHPEAFDRIIFNVFKDVDLDLYNRELGL